MLSVNAYLQDERLPLGQLYVLRRGLVIRLWRFHGPGKVFGEDILLKDVGVGDDELIDHSQAVALTYCEAYILKRHDFTSLARTYPRVWTKVEKLIRRGGTVRSLIRFAHRHKKSPDPSGQKGEGSRAWRPKSFVPKSCSRGAEWVQDSLPIEDKIDRLAELTEILYGSIDAAAAQDGGQQAVQDRVVRRMAGAASASSSSTTQESQPTSVDDVQREANELAAALSRTAAKASELAERGDEKARRLKLLCQETANKILTSQEHSAVPSLDDLSV